MKTYEKIYESASVVMHETRDARKAWRMKFNTLTRLLHDTQTKDAWKITESVYVALNLPTDRKVSRSYIESLVKVWHVDKKGNKFPAYIAKVADKDESGNEVKDESGNLKFHYVTRPVKDGHWDFDKLAKVIGCSMNSTDKKKK